MCGLLSTGLIRQLFKVGPCEKGGLMRNRASEINTWQHLERQEQRNLCVGVAENESFQTQWHGLPCERTSKRTCGDEVLQSEAALSLGRCWADVGGSMFRSRYLTEIYLTVYTRTAIGEAGLSCSLCITFSFFLPALPETIKSTWSTFFTSWFVPPRHRSVQRKTHGKTHVKGIDHPKLKIVQSLCCYFFYAAKWWNF